MKLVKKMVQSALKKHGKRLANIHAPAKPYEEGVTFLKTIIDIPSWVIDIGVADGTPGLWSSFPLADHNYLLIEANPNFYPYLDKLQQNHDSTVRVEKCFCGEEEGSTLFHINKNGHTASRYSERGHRESIEVPVNTLDALAKKNNVTGSVFP